MVWSFMFFAFSFFFINYEMMMIQVITIMLISKAHLSNNQIELNYFFLDGMGTNMAHLSIVLLCLTLMVYMKMNDSKKSILCLMSSVIAFAFFHSNNLLLFFILFEASLIPLVILIIGWGKQPERILAGQYIMIYTLLSSFPFFCFMVWMEESTSLYSMNSSIINNNYNDFWPSSMSWLINISFLFTFLVKVPMFLTHSWLPKAHVEAPLEGSIILAGIMLKVGIFGIFRLLNLFPLDSLKKTSIWFLCISVIGSVMSILMAISSDDLKMSIALSSVSHMNFLLSSMISTKELTSSMTSFTMISHGFSSSILFFFVTIIYEVNNSRSLMLIKGSMSKVPSILFFSLVFFSISIALPPSLSFFGEMMSIFSIWSFSTELMPILCTFIMLNSFFSMMNYGMMVQSAKKKGPKNSTFEMIFNLVSTISLFILIVSFFFPESIL